MDCFRYTWNTTNEENLRVVTGLEGLSIKQVYTHFEQPYVCVLTGLLYFLVLIFAVIFDNEINVDFIDDGQVYSWGKSDNFLTGLGTEQQVNAPLRMEGFDSAVTKVPHDHLVNRLIRLNDTWTIGFTGNESRHCGNRQRNSVYLGIR